MNKKWVKFGLPLFGFLVLSYFGSALIVYPYVMYARPCQVLEGTVIDQDGKPVPGARLVFKEWERTFFLPIDVANIRPTINRSITSDASGSFRLEYYLEYLDLVSGGNKSHLLDRDMGTWSWSKSHGPSCPGKAKVLLYDFSKTNPSQAITGQTEWFPFEVDGKDSYVDLLLERPVRMRSNDSNFVFSIKDIGDGRFMLTVRGINGGVIGSASDLPFAPASGYTPGFSCFYVHQDDLRSGGAWGFFVKSHDGAFHARVVLEISQTAPQRMRLNYVANNVGNRFLFVPIERGMYGWKGPIPVHTANLANTGVYRTLDPNPWWVQNEHALFPLMAHAEFEKLLTTSDKKSGSGEDVGDFLAKQVHAPASVLITLSKQGPGKRLSVAENMGAPCEILELLALETQDKWVANAARKNLDRQMERGVLVSDYLKSRNNFQDECN